jgi:hypothetical protein
MIHRRLAARIAAPRRLSDCVSLLFPLRKAGPERCSLFDTIHLAIFQRDERYRTQKVKARIVPTPHRTA